jgi:hypothetical protein
MLTNPSEKGESCCEPAGTVDQKTNIVSREDDYVELRDDTLVPGRF